MESTSRFAAPIIFVKKSDGTLRMCVDYKELNSITTYDRYPLLHIDDLLDKLYGSRYFTKLDLSSGYHQLRIHPNDRCKTTFVAPKGLFEWRVLPFGLVNAPAIFMRKMHRVLLQYRKYSVVYLDDIMIHLRLQSEHVQHIDSVLSSIPEVGLRLNANKCQFGAEETSFVGFRISAEGIDTDAKTIEAIVSWPMLQSVGEVHSFLGLIGYYHRFVERFAHRSAAQEQFDSLKRVLSSAPVLATMAPNREFILCTDTSDTAIGAVLAQMQPWKERMVERPLAYFSQKLHDVETRYPTYDRELLAIHEALEQWACYVQGRLKTTIYTDHAALQHVLRQRKHSSRQWRHLDLLQQHEYEIKYFPGAANVVADALSRRSHPPEPAPTTDPLPTSPSETQLNDVELRVGSTHAWLDEVRTALKTDGYFAKIVTVPMDGAPNLRELPAREAKDWKKAVARSKNFLLRDEGLLYRATDDHGAGTPRLCVPARLIPEVLTDAHDAPTGGGHNGVERTTSTVSGRFYWPRMSETVRDWVRGCDTCLRMKSTNQCPAGLLSPLDVPVAHGE